MKANTAWVALGAVATSVLTLGFWGCGYGPIEQSYSVQSGAESLNYEIGQKTELPNLMKQMRTAHLNLVDRLTSGASEDAVRAAVQVSMVARDVGKYQPAIAKEGREEAATFKRLASDVQDMSVEIAKAIDSGQAAQADQYYARLYLSCNQCHRLYREVKPPSKPLPIPELETPKPPTEKPKEGETPAPGPGTTPTPAPSTTLAPGTGTTPTPGPGTTPTPAPSTTLAPGTGTTPTPAPTPGAEPLPRPPQ